MFRIALRLVACLVLVMLIAPQVVDAQGRGGNTKPQLLVTKAVADSPVKFICMGGGPNFRLARYYSGLPSAARISGVTLRPSSAMIKGDWIS